VLLIACGAALALTGAGGPGRGEFPGIAVKVAQGALSAVRTADLAGRAGLNGRVTRTFLSPVLDSTADGVATARQELDRASPPDADDVSTRDELSKLLDEAERATSDLVTAFERGDGAAAHAAVDALGPVGDRLTDFIERHRQ
jgi:hypothetical protein